MEAAPIWMVPQVLAGDLFLWAIGIYCASKAIADIRGGNAWMRAYGAICAGVSLLLAIILLFQQVNPNPPCCC